MVARQGIRSSGGEGASEPAPEPAPAREPIPAVEPTAVTEEQLTAFVIEALEGYRGTLVGSYKRADMESGGLNPPPPALLEERKRIILEGIANCDSLITKLNEQLLILKLS